LSGSEEPSHSIAIFFFSSLFFATSPNSFFQIQAFLSLVSTGGFAIFANRAGRSLRTAHQCRRPRLRFAMTLNASTAPAKAMAK
jgi:hypothetical protein